VSRRIRYPFSSELITGKYERTRRGLALIPRTTNKRKANEQLTRALLANAARGIRPRCSDPKICSYWTSEYPTERALAALWCAGCPVFVECGEAADANDEHAHVWAGVDRTRRHGRPKVA
jgi:Transcription factor WhiB